MKDKNNAKMDSEFDNPIDVIELVCTKLGLGFYRNGETELSVAIIRNKTVYPILIMWRQDTYEAVYFSSDMGISISSKQFKAAAVTVAKANERSWLGHFDITPTENHLNFSIFYTFTIPFASSFNFDEINLEPLLNVIADECERFQQYFEIAMNLKNKDEMSDLSLNTLFFEAMGEA